MIASIITALYLSGVITAASAANFLYISGVMLIVAEIALGVFGMVAFNGFLAIFVGYMIQTGDNLFLGIPLDWGLVFGIAFVEFALLAVSVGIILHHRRIKLTTGAESMVGHKAAVIAWRGKKGTVLIQGEIWAAQSDDEMELSKDEEVTVREVQGLTVKIGV